MIVGYARTSSVEQVAGFDAQIVELEKIGCTKIFKEQVSSVGKRAELDSALDFVRDGDVFIVTKLDRLARSVSHLCEIVDVLDKKNVSLKILNINLDTATPTGKLMLNLLSSISQFERELMLERQKVGVQAAKAAGKYKGRKPTALAQKDAVLQLAKKGLTRQEIADQLNIGVASVYRILANDKLAA
jgi:DNA invertase Pin-like site-specific DNA recombinase